MIQIKHSPWLINILRIAGAYNVLGGTFIILFPQLLFDALEIPRINYPMIWQSGGLVVGVYGVGYYLAAKQYIAQWPLILVGFLGKIGGPIGIFWYVFHDQLPLEFLIITFFNDVIWWIPFYIILKQARSYYAN